MRSLFKKLAQSRTAISVRNILNLRPIYINFNNHITSLSVSDAFPWRTDINFETLFKFTDILSFFFDIKGTNAQIVFYDNQGVLLKSIKLKDLKVSNELVINKTLLDGIEGYGTFYIFHEMEQNTIQIESISNKCYTGFSYKGNLHSFVHGNTIVKGKNFFNSNQSSDFILTSFLRNNIYKIQSSFDNVDKSELFFSNPTSKTIYFSIDKKRYSMKKSQCKIVEITNKKDVTIKSNCYFLRPIIFKYKNDFIDVYHG